MKFPPVCKDCGNREVGCHNQCQTYLDTKSEYERSKDEKRKAEHAEHEADTVDIKNRIRIRERTRRNV